MINYKEILRLHELELPINEIGRSCGCDKSTVSRTIKRMSEMGLTWEGIKDMTSDAVVALIHPKSTSCIKYEMPDFQHIKKELARPGVTLQLLWRSIVMSAKQLIFIHTCTPNSGNTTRNTTKKQGLPCIWNIREETLCK